MNTEQPKQAEDATHEKLWELFTEWTNQFEAGEAGQVSVYDGFLAGYAAALTARLEAVEGERDAEVERLKGVIDICTRDKEKAAGWAKENADLKDTLAFYADATCAGCLRLTTENAELRAEVERLKSQAMEAQREKTCKQPDRDVPKLVCGYPLPCPFHK